ncbi:MAG TPA: hypothetical protein VNK04_03430 [Gemmataceae bacterium]|nr:hypothetical protein [Gemmataceae bacterium]
MLSSFVVLSMPWLGPLPDSSVHALVVSRLGYTDIPYEQAVRAFATSFRHVWVVDKVRRRLNDSALTREWFEQYLHAEVVGPWTFRLTVTAPGLSRARQAVILNAVIEAHRDVYIPAMRKLDEEILAEAIRRQSDYRKKAEMLRAEAVRIKKEGLDERLLEPVHHHMLRFEEGVVAEEVRADRVGRWLARGYPMTVILRPARP